MSRCTRCQEPPDEDGNPECICDRLWPDDDEVSVRQLILEFNDEYYLMERPERLWALGVASLRPSCVWRPVEIVDVTLAGVL